MKKNASNKNKILSLVAFFAAMLVGLSSCGVFSLNTPTPMTDDLGDTTEPVTDTTGEDGYTKYEPSYGADMDKFITGISESDWGGGACKIVMSGANIIHGDDNTSTVIRKEYEERNQAVCDTLNLSIVTEVRPQETIFAEIVAANRSGSYYSDIVLLPQSLVGTYGLGGATVNMQSLPEFDLNAEYLFDTSVSATTGGNYVFGVAGDASLTPDCLSAVYFNKAVVENIGLGSIYDLVDSGNWTIDKYLEFMATANAWGVTPYGAQNTSPYLTDLFYFSTGGSLVCSQLNSAPTVMLTAEDVNYRLARIQPAVMIEPRIPALESIETFAAGGSLFLVDSLSTMSSLANSACNWGIAPLPKYDGNQEEYRSLAYYSQAMFFCVPQSAPDYELVGDVISALNIYAYGYTRDSYVTNAAYYYLRDNDSIRMMSKIMENPIYDFAYTFSEAADAIPNATFMAIRNNIMGISSVERYMDMWLGRFNNSVYNLFDIH